QHRPGGAVSGAANPRRPAPRTPGRKSLAVRAGLPDGTFPPAAPARRALTGFRSALRARRALSRSPVLWLPICRQPSIGVPALRTGATETSRCPTTPRREGEAAMGLLRSASGGPRFGVVLLACALGACLAVPGNRADGQKAKTLRIGNSGTLTSTTDNSKEKGALDSLKDFIKSETGMDNEIVRQKDWRELADKMSKKELDIGVFQGYEFAWAQEKHAGLKPLALAVNVHRYPVAYVVTKADNKAADFAGLQG